MAPWPGRHELRLLLLHQAPSVAASHSARLSLLTPASAVRLPLHPSPSPPSPPSNTPMQAAAPSVFGLSPGFDTRRRDIGAMARGGGGAPTPPSPSPSVSPPPCPVCPPCLPPQARPGIGSVNGFARIRVSSAIARR
ncbi:hypothetical protein NL676_013305 [Syzygium grande]|nr:hypothetical protein NL676_013305 [Syzygium grande]